MVFIFLTSIRPGIPSALVHDAAATATGVVNMLPLMRRVSIGPDSNSAGFMLLSLAFARSCEGMCSFIGGGRFMASAVSFTGAFLIVPVLEDIYAFLYSGNSLFVFCKGISLGLSMENSGVAGYFASFLFLLVSGKGSLILFAGVVISGAHVAKAVANMTAAALNLPVVISMVQPEGVNLTVMRIFPVTSIPFSM